MVVHSIPNFGLGGEIPRVIHDSSRPCLGLFIRLVCCCVIALNE